MDQLKSKQKQKPGTLLTTSALPMDSSSESLPLSCPASIPPEKPGDVEASNTLIPGSSHATAAGLNSDVNAKTMNFTLEPYEPRSQRGGTRNRGRNARQTRTALNPRSLAIAENMFGNHNNNYKEFFILKESNDENLINKVNTIKANKDLETHLRGVPDKVTELRNGSLLIKVKDRDQSTRIKQIKRLDGIPVTVSEHGSLNYTKGTIRSKRYVELPETTLVEELTQSNVTEVYKMKRKIDGQLVNTGTIVLTFDRCTLPQSVKIGWNIFEVREYIPNPRRCYNCQKFNHSKQSCRATQPTCVNCGEVGHNENCNLPTQCANCEGPHPASDRKCPHYIVEKEIVATQTKEKIGYGEAKRQVLQRFVEPGVTFGDIFKPKPPRPITSEARVTPNSRMTNNAANPAMTDRQPTRNTATETSENIPRPRTMQTEIPRETDEHRATEENTEKKKQMRKRDRPNNEQSENETQEKCAKIQVIQQNKNASCPTTAKPSQPSSVRVEGNSAEKRYSLVPNAGQTIETLVGMLPPRQPPEPVVRRDRSKSSSKNRSQQRAHSPMSYSDY